ncbi:hypothetical protein LIX17_25445 (plasmid) [Mycobacterium avium subsp. hominissuis]|uniref:hypothetical protein n=1 Tax=Mycobacterium avium TaxID=1764 RepID=UPI0031404740
MERIKRSTSKRNAEPQSGAVPLCVIPGCINEVHRWGATCGECLDDFGPHLRSTGAPALTQQQIAERDSGVQLALALQRQVREANRAPAVRPPHPGRLA